MSINAVIANLRNLLLIYNSLGNISICTAITVTVFKARFE